MESRNSGMLDQPKKQHAKLEEIGNPNEDMTGRDLLVSNVLYSWVGHLVFVIAGFIMPRMIDKRLGQELLGVWDFAWSLVSYFGLVEAGVGSSVNRYVAKYRASGDIFGVNRIASTVFCIQNVAAILILALTIAISLLLPHLFGARLGENVLDAQWVVFLLGSGLAIQMSFTVFSGVLTGCHQWKLHNAIKSGWYMVTVFGMILALFWGGGLTSMSIITLAGITLGAVTHALFAHRVCGGFRLHLSLVGWKTVREVFVFGGKALIPSLSQLLLNQSISVLILAYLGPATLALYSRPRSLIRHMNTLVNKLAHVLTPTTSSLQSTEDWYGIQKLLISSVRYSMYMILPMVLVLALFGSTILKLWMGANYANGIIPAILAVGFLTSIVQMPVFTILSGLNAHGWAGIALFVASLCSVGLTFLVLGVLGWELVGVAVAVTLPLTIMNVFYLPFLACKNVGLEVRRYFLSVIARPMIHVLPFAICLVVMRLVFHTKPLAGFLWSGVIGSALLVYTYCHYLLPVDCINKLRVLDIYAQHSNNILRLLRKSFFLLMRWLGLIRLFQFLHRYQIAILMLHGVMDEQDDSSWVPLWPRLSPVKLEKYLKVLKRRYRFVSMMDALDMLQGRKPIQPYSMVLTLDDGYQNNITHALPILRRNNVPATFFIPTGFLSNSRLFWIDRLDYALQQVQVHDREVKIGSSILHLDSRNREALRRGYDRLRRRAKEEQMPDWEVTRAMELLAEQFESESGRKLADIHKDDDWTKIMSWEQVEELDNCEVTFGSHTVDHIRLVFVDIETARDQLVCSKRDIETHIGKPCTCLAYPSGNYSKKTIELAKEAGYRCCVTTEEGLNHIGDDCLKLKRVHMPLSASASELLAIVCGLSRFIFRVKRILWLLLRLLMWPWRRTTTMQSSVVPLAYTPSDG